MSAAASAAGAAGDWTPAAVKWALTLSTTTQVLMTYILLAHIVAAAVLCVVMSVVEGDEVHWRDEPGRGLAPRAPDHVQVPVAEVQHHD